jgi:putative addiction module component (TIGR02574 family)
MDVNFFALGRNQATIEAALALPEDERIRLVERLLETLGPETDRVNEESFLEELKHRSDEIDQGKADLVPWPEIKFEPFSS